MTKAALSDATGRPVCHICRQAFPASKMRPWISVRPGVSDLIAKTAPGWAEGKHICKSDLARFRRQYVEQLLEDERGELDHLDRIDHQLAHQWEKLAELQQIQIELLEENADGRR